MHRETVVLFAVASDLQYVAELWITSECSTWSRRYFLDELQKVVAPLLTRWRHQMETFSVLLAFCAGNSPVTGEFPAQKPATRRFDVFFDQHPNVRLSKQSRGWWFETPSRPLWRHSNVWTIWHTEFPLKIMAWLLHKLVFIWNTPANYSICE